ncbi:hypothetical protein BLJ79_10925 [Arthrobacter sp. UCD-GKA]|uniref:hypothetical protein n=1 Tax=Arthrobacter sp. UCD-GKA TaxID=1913576 RepID=UPI0008DC8AA0|nr:hypothetical protein [Arthrobacter sp. UCD-GKA]OIH84629.1 hypothetical protein BLJ79_10925 [Arthrobacter sp. UCD-GKA]
MSKSKSAGKPRSGHPGRNPSAGASKFEDQVRTAMRPYTAQLRAFFNQRHTPDDSEAGIEGLVTLLTVHARLRGKVAVSELDHDALAIQFTDLRELGDEVAVACAAMLREFMLFLAETGRWSGEVEEFKAVFDLLSAQGGQSPVVVPELDEASADERWAKLPMVATARALLAWLGEGREVAEDGLLLPTDLVSAAAAVGLEVRLDPESEVARPGWAPETGSSVATLAQLPKLGTYWDALLRAGVLSFQEGRALPNPVVAEALNADSGFSARGAKDLVAEGIYAHILLNAVGPDADHTVTQMAAALLAKAGSANPPRTEAAFSIPAPGELEPEQAHLQPLFAKTVPAAEALLRAAEAEGLVRIGKHIRVPRVLRAPLERALTRVAEEVLS